MLIFGRLSAYGAVSKLEPGCSVPPRGAMLTRCLLPARRTTPRTGQMDNGLTGILIFDPAAANVAGCPYSETEGDFPIGPQFRSRCSREGGTDLQI